METNINPVSFMKLTELIGKTEFIMQKQLDGLQEILDQAAAGLPKSIETLNEYVLKVNEMIKDGLYEPDKSKLVLREFDLNNNIMNVDSEWRELASKYYWYVIHDKSSSQKVDDVEHDFGMSLLFEYGDDNELPAQWSAFMFWQVWNAKCAKKNKRVK